MLSFNFPNMKNRSRYEVIAAILKSANREETRTKIMYKAMLSNDQCKIYLDSSATKWPHTRSVQWHKDGLQNYSQR
jgi:predicted transcriptional regulator